MAVVFACESLRPALDEALPMLAAHQAVVAPYGSPDRSRQTMAVWDAADEAGQLRTFTARTSGVLVGFATFQVGRHPNFHARYASQHALCLEPAHRRGRVGYEFVTFIDGMRRTAAPLSITRRSRISARRCRASWSGSAIGRSQRAMSRRCSP